MIKYAIGVGILFFLLYETAKSAYKVTRGTEQVKFSKGLIRAGRKQIKEGRKTRDEGALGVIVWGAMLLLCLLWLVTSVGGI